MARPDPVSVARRQRGASLVEMLVALVVLLLALLVAGDLLLESGRLLAASGARARDPVAAHAAEQLRNDLRGAVTVASAVPPGRWVDPPLELLLPSGATISYAAEGERLVRRWQRGGLAAERTVLAPVERFQWRLVGSGVFEVEVVYRQSAGGFLQRTTGPVQASPGAERERIDVVARARGGGGSRW